MKGLSKHFTGLFQDFIPVSFLISRTPYRGVVVLPDPYCLVSFHTSSDRTRVISETVCPTWDQTMLMKSIRIFGDTSKVVESPPPIIIEFMDKDTVVSGRGSEWVWSAFR